MIETGGEPPAVKARPTPRGTVRRAGAWLWDHPLVLVMFAVVLLSWDQSYNGRRDVVQSQRASCHAGERERFALMEAWYGAALARQDDARRLGEPYPTGQDWVSANTYLEYIRTAMLRADPEHSLRWPDPRVAGSRAPFTRPMGVGRYSCAAAFPAATPVQFGVG